MHAQTVEFLRAWVDRTSLTEVLRVDYVLWEMQSRATVREMPARFRISDALKPDCRCVVGVHQIHSSKGDNSLLKQLY